MRSRNPATCFFCKKSRGQAKTATTRTGEQNWFIPESRCPDVQVSRYQVSDTRYQVSGIIKKTWKFPQSYLSEKSRKNSNEQGKLKLWSTGPLRRPSFLGFFIFGVFFKNVSLYFNSWGPLAVSGNLNQIAHSGNLRLVCAPEIGQNSETVSKLNQNRSKINFVRKKQSPTK